MTAPLPGYEEFAELGAGATGTVTVARATEGALVAIKRLAPQLTGDPAWVARYRAEAEVLRDLRHPNVVALRELVETGDDVAIVMEFVAGVSLRRLIDSRGTALPEAALLVLKGSLLGLGHAHAAGVVHRDYKPENVLVTATGDSRLLDFGIAVPVGEVRWRAGTAEYMAPEQWRIGEVSPATDVYAAAAVFFECLTGHPPFTGDQEQLRTAHDLEPPPVEEVPEPVRGLVAAGLAKNPARRFADAPVFVAALEDAAVAGYGPDWEERGRRALAAAASAAIALLPVGALAALGGAAAGAVSGELSAEAAPPQGAGAHHHQRNLVLTGAGVGVVLLLILAIVGLSREQGGGDLTGQEAGVAVGSSTSIPGGGAGSQTPSTTPAGGATATPSASATSAPSASASATATHSARPTTTPTASARPTATPTPTAPPTPTPSSSATPAPSLQSASIAFESCVQQQAGSGIWSCTFQLTFTSTGQLTVDWTVNGTAYDCASTPNSSSSSVRGTTAGSGTFTSTTRLTFTVTPLRATKPPTDTATVTTTAGPQGMVSGWSRSPQC